MLDITHNKNSTYKSTYVYCDEHIIRTSKNPWQKQRLPVVGLPSSLTHATSFIHKHLPLIEREIYSFEFSLNPTP